MKIYNTLDALAVEATVGMKVRNLDGRKGTIRTINEEELTAEVDWIPNWFPPARTWIASIDLEIDLPRGRIF